MSASNPNHPATCSCSMCDYAEFLQEFAAATPDCLEQVDASKPLDVTQEFRVAAPPVGPAPTPAVRWSEHGLRISGEDAASFLRALADPEGYPDRPTGVSGKLQRVAKWIEESSSELSALRVALETANECNDEMRRELVKKIKEVEALRAASLGAGFPQDSEK